MVNQINDLFSLKDKVAVVTGASRGLGFAIAKGYSQFGANLAITSRNEDEIKEAAQVLKDGTTSEVLGIKCDSTKSEDIDDLFSTVEKKLGPVDIFMNNAGVIHRPRTNVWELTKDAWDRVIEINLTGTFLGVKRALQDMIPRKQGKIVCMASVTSVIGQAGHSPYVSSKGGIAQFVKAAALEAAEHNIQINAIGPTYIKSNLIEETMSDRQKLEDILSKIPMGRIGETDDLIGACIFLSSRASDFITGHLLMIDGGHSIK
jgi:2-deoxy-D-gluconate 3-dehydrogenase